MLVECALVLMQWVESVQENKFKMEEMMTGMTMGMTREMMVNNHYKVEMLTFVMMAL